jgi:hypothetical protein
MSLGPGIKSLISLIRYGQNDAGSTKYGPPNADASGNIISKLAATLAPTGGVDELTAQEPTADAKDPAAGPFFVEALDVIPYTYFFNGATWDRARTAPDNADAQAALGLGTQGVVARLQGWNGATYDRVGTQGDNADAVPVATLGHVKAWAHNGLFNGVTWDRQRGNVEGTALPSAVYNGGPFASPDIITYNARGIVCFLNITAVPGVVTVNAKLQYKDPVSGVYVDIPGGASANGFAPGSASSSATGIFIFQTGNVSIPSFASTILSRTVRIVTTHSGAGNFTYSVGYSLQC